MSSPVTATEFGLTVERKFSDAQIKALPTNSPLLIVPAPGDRRVIIPTIAVLTLNPWSANYTNIAGGSNFSFNTPLTPYPTPTLTGAGILAQGHATVIWADIGREFDFTPYDFTKVNNQPLNLVVTNPALGNFTGGSPEQILTVLVYYSIFRPFA